MRAKRLLSTAGCLAAVPWMGLGLLLAFAGAAYSKVGHWPQFNRPDPSDVRLALVPVGDLVVIAILLLAIASVAASVVFAFQLFCVLVEDRGSFVTARVSHVLVHFSVCAFGAFVFLLALRENANWLGD